MKHIKEVEIVALALALILIGSLMYFSRSGFPVSEELVIIPPQSLVSQASAPTSNLAAHFSFDDGSGADSAGGSNGTITGATAGTGKYNQALVFDGVNDCVDAGNASALNITGAVSVSAWVNPRSSALNRSVVAKSSVGGGSASQQYHLYDQGSGRYGFTVGNGSSILSAVTSSGAVPTNAWSHLVGTYNGSDTVKIYLNGVLISTQTASIGSLNQSGKNFTIGSSHGGSPCNGGYFDGSIDEVRVYTRELGLSDVQGLYGTTVSAPAVVNGSCSATLNTCSAGTLSDTADTSTEYKWQCIGSGDTAITASCSLPLTQTQTQATAPSTPGIKTVKKDGSGNYTTIQACANAAVAGDICLVYPGTYAENVDTVTGGTSDSSRIKFKAEGAVTMHGFDIKHPYITIEGFDITSPSNVSYAHVLIYAGGNNCQILNNTIRDGYINVQGIYFYSQNNLSANNCVVRGNTLRNLLATFFTVSGSNHLFENNILERLNSRDYIYLFGNGHTFRRNIFREGNVITGFGNHPDWVQTFGNNGQESYNMLFEENWVENLDPSVQLGQIVSGGLARGITTGIHDWTFRKNVFINVGNNMNSSLPGLIWENNTFYKVAYTQDGVAVGGSLTRGDSSRNFFQNNVFLALGTRPLSTTDTSGYYSLTGATLTKEVISFFAANENGAPGTITTGISNDLVTNGYLENTNGGLTAKAHALTDVSQFVIASAYSSYKNTVYDLLKRTSILDKQIRATIGVDYNYVAGDSPSFYPKRSDSCTTGVWTPFRFCEPHGINGGDPRLQNINDPDGPDNIPFTSDDGLKPVSGSPLCGRGYNGTDIGAYSCSSGTVLAASSGSLIPASGSGATTPPPPTSCSTTNTCKAGDFDGNGDVNTLDSSYMNSKWNTNDAKADLNKDGVVNTLDYAIMVKNWTPLGF
jgi:hypothetical protein